MTKKLGKEYLFLFSQENSALAFAECQALHQEATNQEFRNEYAVLNSSQLNVKHLAYTKQVFEIIKKGSLDEIKEYIHQHRQKNVKESFSFKRICVNKDLEDKVLSSSETRALLLTYVENPLINLTAPDKHIVLICTTTTFYLAEQVWVNKEQFTQRKNQFRPAPHPTSLDPKLARALINLLNPKEHASILDPFCGSGGILIESCLMNFQTFGIDSDPLMIKRAEKNLSFFSLSGNLKVGDARKDLFAVDSIVTDLPYGKNSKADNLEELYSAFLRVAKKYANSMLVAAPNTVNTKKFIKEAGWHIEKYFSWPLNKSLTKEIFVLTQVN